MRYDFDDMYEKSAELEKLAENFIARFTQTADSIEWEGTAREYFNKEVATVTESIRQIAKFPREKASEMQETDHRLAEMLRGKFL